MEIQLTNLLTETTCSLSPTISSSIAANCAHFVHMRAEAADLCLANNYF
jgi:hypothetical protein